MPHSGETTVQGTHKAIAKSLPWELTERNRIYILSISSGIVVFKQMNTSSRDIIFIVRLIYIVWDGGTKDLWGEEKDSITCKRIICRSDLSEIKKKLRKSSIENEFLIKEEKGKSVVLSHSVHQKPKIPENLQYLNTQQSTFTDNYWP